MYSLLADVILLLHALLVAFVVIGFILIVVGMVRDWAWIKNFWFRLAHLVTIGIVTVQALFGRYCPLTLWESQLRRAAGENFYSTSFVQYWLQQIIYYELPLWFFAVLYTVFTLLVLLTWIVKPPKKPGMGATKTGRR